MLQIKSNYKDEKLNLTQINHIIIFYGDSRGRDSIPCQMRLTIRSINKLTVISSMLREKLTLIIIYIFTLTY